MFDDYSDNCSQNQNSIASTICNTGLNGENIPGTCTYATLENASSSSFVNATLNSFSSNHTTTVPLSNFQTVSNNERETASHEKLAKIASNDTVAAVDVVKKNAAKKATKKPTKKPAKKLATKKPKSNQENTEPASTESESTSAAEEEAVTTAKKRKITPPGDMIPAQKANARLKITKTLRDTINRLGERGECTVALVIQFKETASVYTSDDTSPLYECIGKAVKSMGEPTKKGKNAETQVALCVCSFCSIENRFDTVSQTRISSNGSLRICSNTRPVQK